MKQKKALFFVVFIGIALTFLSAETKVNGIIDYLEGIVDVHRDGEMLDWTLVDMGFELEQYDLVETGDNGYAEISVQSPSSRGNVVKVSENTAFYFDFDEEGGAKETRFEMLAGSLSFKVQRVAGGGSVSVKTESAVMGVRGTEFTVTAAPEGSILVTCETGKVSCASDTGRELFALPGKAVEQPRDAQIRELSIDISDLGLFRDQWVEQKIENFIPNSTIVMKGFVNNYIKFGERFETSHTDLMKHSSTFKSWERDIDAGRSISSAVTDKIKVSPAIFKMRSILPIFERSFYRIQNLQNLYEEYDLPNFRIQGGYTVDDFFRDFDRDRENLKWKLSQVRYIFKLYAKMEWSGGGNDLFGGDSMMDDIFSGGNSPF